MLETLTLPKTIFRGNYFSLLHDLDIIFKFSLLTNNERILISVSATWCNNCCKYETFMNDLYKNYLTEGKSTSIIFVNINLDNFDI